MTYTCTDFTDTILDALDIEVPKESWDSPSDQADLALAEIERLKSRTFWQARYESRHFHFEAYGPTKEEAIQVLRRGLSVHARQYDCEPDWFEEYFEDNLMVLEISLGAAYRDGGNIA